MIDNNILDLTDANTLNDIGLSGYSEFPNNQTTVVHNVFYNTSPNVGQVYEISSGPNCQNCTYDAWSSNRIAQANNNVYFHSADTSGPSYVTYGAGRVEWQTFTFPGNGSWADWINPATQLGYDIASAVGQDPLFVLIGQPTTTRSRPTLRPWRAASRQSIRPWGSCPTSRPTGILAAVPAADRSTSSRIRDSMSTPLDGVFRTRQRRDG